MSDLRSSLGALAPEVDVAASRTLFADRRKRRRRRSRLLLAAAVLAVVAAVGAGALFLSGRDDERSVVTVDEPQPSAVVVPVVDAGPLDGLRVSSVGNARALLRGGDEVLVVDGLAQTDDGSVTMQAWLAPVDDPARSQRVDLSAWGPRGQVTALWWDDEFVIAGVACPGAASWPGAEDSVIEDRCGSTSWDVIRFDPATHEVRPLLTDIVLGPDEGLGLRGATSTGLLVNFGGEYRLISKGGLDAPSAEQPLGEVPGNTGFTVFCAVGDTFVALTELAPMEGTGRPRPLDEYYTVHRLAGSGVWEPVPTPASTTVTGYSSYTKPGGCGGGGIAVGAVDSPGSRPEEPTGRWDVEVLTMDADDQLVWTALPTSTPPPAGGIAGGAALYDGRIVRDDAGRLVVWMVEEAEWRPVGEMQAGLVRLMEVPIHDPVLVEQDTAVLHFSEWRAWEQPLRHDQTVVLSR